MMGTFSAVAVYLALSILLNLGLAVRVVLLRRSTHTSRGGGGHEQLEWAIRAHANNSEYAPFALAAWVFLALLDCPAIVIHAIGLSYLAGRLLSAQSLGWKHGRGLERQIGMGLNAFSLVASAIALLVLASELQS